MGFSVAINIRRPEMIVGDVLVGVPPGARAEDVVAAYLSNASAADA